MQKYHMYLFWEWVLQCMLIKICLLLIPKAGSCCNSSIYRSCRDWLNICILWWVYIKNKCQLHRKHFPECFCRHVIAFFSWKNKKRFRYPEKPVVLCGYLQFLLQDSSNAWRQINLTNKVNSIGVNFLKFVTFNPHEISFLPSMNAHMMHYF